MVDGRRRAGEGARATSLPASAGSGPGGGAGAYRILLSYRLVGDQGLQRFHISQVVSGIINRRLSNKRARCKPRIVQQPPEWLQPNGSLPDVLVAVQMGAARRLGVVAVPEK